MPFYIGRQHWDAEADDFRSLIGRLRITIANYEPAMLEVERLNMQAIKKMAIKNSSYTAYVKNSLAPYYPYALRTNAPLIAPYFANMQSGDMSRSWRVQSVRTPKGITSTIWNDMKYSRFFDGQNTRKMIPRPVLQYILHQSRAPRMKRLHEEHMKFLASKRRMGQ